MRFGYDGIVFANGIDEPAYEFAPRLVSGLAKQLPLDGQMTDNPNQNWHDVNGRRCLNRRSLPSFPAPSTARGKYSRRR